MQPHFRIIPHGSHAYAQMLRLRTDVLLKPIGISPSFIKPEQEQEDILIGVFDGDTLIGCCVLTRKAEHTVQLRQMAIAFEAQGKSIGSALLGFAEQVASAKHFQTLMLHARDNVVPFYQKSGYTVVSEPFEEVGIQHFRMEKPLQAKT